MRKKRKQAESEAPQLEPRRITPVDIQQREFRLAMRGYNERDVDQFLDEVTEEVARLYADNKRLREEIEFNRTTRLPTTDAAEAEAIIRRAREESARIIAEAGARASTMAAAADPGQSGGSPTPASGAPPTEILSVFLPRERAFLQNMANLIQAHAEGVKQDVRRVRDQIVRQSPADSASAAQAPTPDVEQLTTAAPPEEPARPPDVPAGGPIAGADEDARVEAASASSAVDEPTQAWGMGAAEAEPAEGKASPNDIVDLTRGPRERAGEAPGWASRTGQASVESDALSRANGPNRAIMQTGPAIRPGGDARAPDHDRPRTEEEDAKEDRSLRELFWGEE
ncbi:MAG: DivIVA domain-containing protein [Actinomycetota bacterium]